MKDLIIVVLAVMIVLALAFMSAQRDINKCENVGGIYYSGFFGASNCIFPPK